jgi:hypothetical protein
MQGSIIICANPDQGSQAISADGTKMQTDWQAQMPRTKAPPAANRNLFNIIRGPLVNDLDLQTRPMRRRPSYVLIHLLVGQGFSPSVPALPEAQIRGCQVG